MGDFIQTRGSQVRTNAVENFQSVIFEARKKVKSNNNITKTKAAQADESDKNATENNIDPKRKQELEMKRARYDVMKFGIAGFQKVTAENAKVALAVSLGAKPPKNQVVNYKVLMEQRKKKKEAVADVQQVSGLAKSLIKHKVKKKPQKGAGGILGKYGKIQKGTSKKK